MTFNKSRFLQVAIALFFVLSSAPLFAQSPVPDGSQPVKLDDGFSLSEGPYWHPDGYLLFSDVSASVIYKWTEEEGVKSYKALTNQTNGITADLYGNILVAQHKGRQIGTFSSQSARIKSVASTYDGKKLHSPNDLVVKSDGAVFFTDPPWGGNPSELNFHGVYRIPPGSSETQLLVDSLSYPNGIAFSPDETKLYVSETNSSKIHVFDVVDDSTLANGRVFVTVNQFGNADQSSSDGLKVDNAGNVWATGSEGVAIFSPEAELLDIINIPGSTTNLAFGGSENLTLFITNFSGLYKLDLGPLTRPSAPENLQALKSETAYSLSWEASNEAIRNISVYRSANGSDFEKIYAAAFTESFEDTTIEAGSTYSYKVTVTDMMGFESEFSNETGDIHTANEEETDVAFTFKLDQNYPNPFNPSTVISYQLAANSTVSLKVFDLLGREVAALINNELKSAGTHSMTWTAAGFPSGVYIYTLKTEFGSFSRKLTLVK